MTCICINAVERFAARELQDMIHAKLGETGMITMGGGAPARLAVPSDIPDADWHELIFSVFKYVYDDKERQYINEEIKDTAWCHIHSRGGDLDIMIDKRPKDQKTTKRVAAQRFDDITAAVGNLIDATPDLVDAEAPGYGPVAAPAPISDYGEALRVAEARRIRSPWQSQSMAATKA